MSSATSDGLSTSDRGAKHDVFYVTRDPQMVGILSEGGLPDQLHRVRQDAAGFLPRERGRGRWRTPSRSISRPLARNMPAAPVPRSTGTALTASDGPTFNEGRRGLHRLRHHRRPHLWFRPVRPAPPARRTMTMRMTRTRTILPAPPAACRAAAVRPGRSARRSIAEGPGTGDVQYIIFTDPENKKLNMEVGDEKQLGIKLTGDSHRHPQVHHQRQVCGDHRRGRRGPTRWAQAAARSPWWRATRAAPSTCGSPATATARPTTAAAAIGRGSNSSNSGRVEDVTGKTVETTGITIKGQPQRGARGRVDAAAGDLLPIQRDGGGTLSGVSPAAACTAK